MADNRTMAQLLEATPPRVTGCDSYSGNSPPTAINFEIKQGPSEYLVPKQANFLAMNKEDPHLNPLFQQITSTIEDSEGRAFILDRKNQTPLPPTVKAVEQSLCNLVGGVPFLSKLSSH
ncbi:hypothetical protein Tco_0064634 [Tanacetum coccineum]